MLEQRPIFITRGRGFTLLELLVVLLIASLVIGLVGASFGSAIETARWKKSAREVLAVLKQARNLSVSQGKMTRFLIDADRQQYVVDDRAYDWPEAVRLEMQLNSWLPQAADEPISAVGSELLFFPDGSSSGGVLSLVSERGVLDIEVNWLTGRVVLHENE